MEIFIEFAGVVFVATIFSILMRVLKQPLIVGYILAGIVMGPYFLNIYQTQENIELFSRIGITILLFILGLNLSPRIIKEVGKASLILGVGQIIFSFLTGLFVSVFLGFNFISAVFISMALTFSSTIISLKLLSDKGDLNKLYGRVAVGFLLLQDVVATIILLALPSLSQTGSTDIVSLLGILCLKAAAIILILYLMSQFVMPRVSSFMASSSELLFLFSMTWGLGFASLFYILGFSVEIGALIAGVMLSLTPFSYEIEARMKPLRDFFIVLFFVLLGSRIVIENAFGLVVPALILSLLVIVGHPLIVVIIMNILGYKKRTGFMTGITVSQISEFSLIITALAFNLGYIQKDVSSLITMIGLITIAVSAYFITNADEIYGKLEKILGLFELRKSSGKSVGTGSEGYEILLFGYDRVGQDFLKAFDKLEKDFLVIDFNPNAIKFLEEANIPYRFGDARDVEFLSGLNLSKVRMVVSTILDFKANLLLTQKVKDGNSNAIIIVIAQDILESEELYENGASYVIMPHYLGARYASNMILRYGFDNRAFKDERERHIDHLRKRKKSENINTELGEETKENKK